MKISVTISTDSVGRVPISETIDTYRSFRRKFCMLSSYIHVDISEILSIEKVDLIRSINPGPDMHVLSGRPSKTAI